MDNTVVLEEKLNELASKVSEAIIEAKEVESKVKSAENTSRKMEEIAAVMTAKIDDMSILYNQADVCTQRLEKVETKLQQASSISKIDDLKTLVEATNKKVDSLMGMKKEIDTLYETISGFTEEMGDIRDNISSVSDDLSSFEKKADTKINLIADSVKKNSTPQASSEGASAEVSPEILSNIKELESKLSAFTTSFDEIKKEITLKFKNIDEKSVARDIVIKSFQKTLETFKSEFVSLKQNVAEKSSSDNTEKVFAIESKLADLVAKFEKGEFNSKPADISEDIKSKLSNFEKNISDLSSKIVALEARPQVAQPASVPSIPSVSLSDVDYDPELLESFENPQPEPGIDFKLSDLLQVMIKHQASDLHLKEGAPPTVRLEGELIPIGSAILSDVNCKYLVMSGVPKYLRKKILKDKELDFAYSIPEARFRVHVYMQRGTVSASYRMIKTSIPSIETLHLPTAIKNFANLNSGLILVTGPSGSGKTVTLTSMIDYMNTNLKLHIVTIEDPIEFIHTDKLSLVTQREVGNDTLSCLSAIKSSLREDPNVIMIGELTDAETVMTATTAAENGHLVLSSLYTPNVVQTITRLVDMFPEQRKNQYRSLLSSTLKAVISQKLIPRADGEGRIPACEVLIVNPAIAKLISTGKFDDIYPLIVEGKGEGMMTFSQSLSELCDSGIISKEALYAYSDNKEDVEMVNDVGENVQASAIQDDVMMSWL